ncbi:MAG: ATP-binding protein [Acidobacteria bacterium]|nr:ATP-binding protein [Acidobacteriota bacterium]
MNYEQLGLFYLGRRYDAAARQSTSEPVLYDSSDLLTHAVCIGMTGSGKTGLGIALIEEAAIDGLPVLAIDPKGDLANLMLTFPGLSAQEFLPWVNPDEARAQQLTPEAFATNEAARWKAGLAEWDQDGARIARLKAAADVTVYTPGSRAGLPLSILETFSPPPRAVLDEPELLAARVQSVATSLLALAGVSGEATTSREHVLVSTLLQEAWRGGATLDLAALIGQVQAPPMTKVGVLELEAFYPASERFALAMKLNNVLAAPGFATWLEGDPLDIAKLLYTSEGKPRIAVVSIAHLGDAERMFFVALLLEQVLAWMRSQRGTTSLRAVLYMDELFGFLPPTANPPSKVPLLTLLKQARAFGLGCVLSTQNPVDLDYKALANAGTWFLGRLQTERDKARVLDGLEGVASGSGQGFDRQGLDRLLSGLEKRVFLLHNVHDSAPLLLRSRWALSYLRGPMGRDEIRALMDPQRAVLAAAAAPVPLPSTTSVAASPAAPPAAPAPVAARPIVAPDVPQFFAPGVGDAWVPMLVGAARLTYSDAKLGLDETTDIVVWTPLTDGPVAADWEHAEPADFLVDALTTAPRAGGTFASLPQVAAKAKSYAEWTKSFSSWAARSQTIELLRSDKTGFISHPGEAEATFRVRVNHAAREARDEAIATLRAKQAPKLTAMDERIRKAGAAIEKEQQQATDSKFTTAVSVGASVLGALFGRKVVSATNAGRVATAARGVSRMGREAQDVDRAVANEAALVEQRQALADALEQELQSVQATWGAEAEEFDTVVVKPKRGGVQVRLVALVWRPE